MLIQYTVSFVDVCMHVKTVNNLSPDYHSQMKNKTVMVTLNPSSKDKGTQKSPRCTDKGIQTLQQCKEIGIQCELLSSPNGQDEEEENMDTVEEKEDPDWLPGEKPSEEDEDEMNLWDEEKEM